MKKKGFVWGTLVIIGMVFGLVLAGCENPSGDGTGVDPLEEQDPAAATQLADELNARPKSSDGDLGRAEVNGATVTLKGGFIDVRTALTVSKGVILDVTADGHLGLHDVILTVNGTVNANSNRIRLEDSATWATIDGNGTIYLKGKGRLLQVEGNHNVADRTLTLDGVTLVGVEDNDQPLVVVRSGGEERSGHFIMKSGKITDNSFVRNGTGDGNDWADGGGVKVEDGGTFTMKGGEISGNHAVGSRGSGGGGVAAVNVNSTFIMEGGTISGNSATSEKRGEGGGVKLYKGSFTLKGGEISGNKAEGGEGAGGGGVFMYDGGTFTMEGGTISGNMASGKQGGNGGGVEVQNGGTFTMEDGEISGNTAEGERARGGGVRVGDESEFTMSGGTISGNRATGSEKYGESGGVDVDGATFTMSGGTISENTASGKEKGSGGGVLVTEESVFTLKGGTVSGNRATGKEENGEGGGVDTRGTFTMESGEISGNTASGNGARGGGVRVTGTFTMKGGEVSGNTASGEEEGAGGGGVNVVGDGALFTLKGGTISGNSATSEEWSGGAGVRVDMSALFILEGGTVYGKTGKLPEGVDTSLANSSAQSGASLSSYKGTAKWGTGGTYTIGNASGTGGSDIVTSDGDSVATDETLIAVLPEPEED